LRYLLDTDVVIDYLTATPPTPAALAPLWRDGIAISVVNYMELVEGIRDSRNRRSNELAFRRFLKRARVLGVTRPVAEHAARLRSELRSGGRRINHRHLDILIAATAIEYRLVLITRNLLDYSDIAGIRLISLADLGDTTNPRQ
jgi:predicted nucleic acid-binding protein